MMKLLGWQVGWVIVAGVFLARTVVAQPEQWLQYHTSPEGRASRWMELSTNPPPDVVLPTLNAKPCFARWVTPLDPAGGRWLCLDRTRKSGPYDRLFIDSNGNGRLDDETPLKANRTDQYYGYFDPVRLGFKGEDGPITYHLLLRSYRNDDDSADLLLSSGGWYEGKVELAGKKRRIELIDGNINGTFNDRSTNAYACDRVMVEGDKTAQRFLGRMLEVDGQIYRIETARDGAFVKLQKADPVALGPVRVPEAISEFTAFGENGHFVRQPAKGQFTLPLGKYRVQGWTIDRKDNKGMPWKLSGYSFNESADFEVVGGKAAALDIGEPVRVLFQAAERTNNQIAFNLRFRGNLDESIEFQREGKRPRAPQLTVTNTDGSLRYTNSFEFG